MNTLKDLLNDGLTQDQVLALDINTQCGYCSANGSGNMQIPNGQTSGQEKGYYYGKWLEELLISKNIKFVCVAGWFLGELAPSFTLARLHGITDYICAKHNIPIIRVQNDHIKIFVTGKAKATAKQMIYNIKERFGVTCKTYTEANAIGLWHFFMYSNDI